ncbi:MAG: hypothetical protein GQ522_00235 [Deltaproteobacteria bacterium]|nr:hypothetical protein [Deltaproteobacteria bacterium]
MIQVGKYFYKGRRLEKLTKVDKTREVPLEEHIDVPYAQEQKRSRERRNYVNPLRFLLIITFSIFIVEALVMFIAMPLLPPLPQEIVALFDALLLTLLILPTLYYFLFKPMVTYIKERENAEDSLRGYQHHLEELVKEKTASLYKAIDTLKGEVAERIRAEEGSKHKSQELEILTEDLRKYSSQLAKKEEETRRSLARILHEQVGQNLIAMKMKCSGLLKEDDFDEEKLRETISSHITLLQSTIQATRKLTSDLFPSILDDLGFIPAVRWYSDSVLKSSGIKVTLDIDKSVEGIPAEVKLSIFRIVQEAFQNIATHASATTVEVALEWHSGNALRLNIRDNGVGFDGDHINSTTDKGIGLTLIKERALSMGGMVKVNSSKGVGTEMSVEVPLPRERGR